jgi:hypothetical protein
MTTENAIRDLLRTGGPIKVAVAYWGAGATERLGLGNREDVEVVCDLRSGSCNPDEIRKLRDAIGLQNVLTLDNLHAKVWLAPTQAIVGSSNASTNGLCFEGDEARSLIEANMSVDDLAIVSALQGWWHGKVRQRARPITEQDLDYAEILFRNRRTTRPITAAPNLLSAIMKHPGQFKDRNLYIWIWKQSKLSPWAEDALEDVKKVRGPNIDSWQDVENPPPPGSYVLDFSLTKKRAEFGGLWQILTEEPVFEPASGKGKLLLCVERQQFGGLLVGDVKEWEAAAYKFVTNNGSPDEDEWPADVFGEWFRRENVV